MEKSASYGFEAANLKESGATTSLGGGGYMKKFIALGAAAVGGVIVFRFLPRPLRGRLTSSVRHRMGERMKQMMAGLPEDSPPKLIMSILPKLQEQNDQIIAMLREQNELLRQQGRDSAAKTAA
jgi:hypothetical protein